MNFLIIICYPGSYLALTALYLWVILKASCTVYLFVSSNVYNSLLKNNIIHLLKICQSERFNCVRRNEIKLLARIVSQYSRHRTGIEIHPAAVIAPGVFIDHGMGVVIGETAEVGAGTVIYQGVTLGGTGKQTGKRHPTVGENCVISAGAKVLGDITIGDCAKVGAGAVVLRDVPAHATVVGVPARVVRIRGSKEGVDLCQDSSDPVRDELCALRERMFALEEAFKELRNDG